MKKVTIAIWILFVFAAVRGYSVQFAPVSTIGDYTTYGITQTVPVTAASFTNIGGWALQISYDPAIVTVTSVTKGPNLGGTLDVNLLNPGLILLSWFHSPPGATLNLNDVVVNINFAKKKSGTSPVIFIDDGTSCEWYNGIGTGLPDTPYSSFYNSGSVTFASLPAPVTTATTLSACPGSTIQIPVTVNGFTNIGALTLVMNYDLAVLTFAGATTNPAFPDLTVNGDVPGAIYVAGYSPGAGITISDNTVLYTLTFTCVSSAANTGITWNDTGHSCEYADYPGYTTLAEPAGTYVAGSVTVYPPLTAAITGGISPICANTSPGTFTATGGGGTGSYTYQWYTTPSASISGATSETYNPGNITDNTGYYCAITSGACGTVNTETESITVISRPTGILSGGASYCEGYNTLTELQISLTGSGTISGTLSDGTPFSGTAPTTWVDVTPSITTTYTIATLQDENCDALQADLSGEATVTINPLPVQYTVTGGGSYCDGGPGASVGLDGSNDGITYDLYLNGTIVATKDGSSGVLDFGTFTEEGTYTVQATDVVTDCMNWMNGEAVITINPLPSPQITGDASVCAGSAGNIYSTPGTEGNSYLWEVSGGSIVGSATGTSVSVTWDPTGSGWVMVTETGGIAQCNGSTEHYIVTFIPLPAPSISGPILVGSGSVGNVYSTADVIGHSYSWTIDGGSIIGSATGNSITVTWGTGISGWVKVTETTAAPASCSATTGEYNVTISHSPVLEITGCPTACCGNSSAPSHYCGIVTGLYVAPLTYEWTVSGGSISNGSNTSCIDVVWSCCGQGTINLVVSDANGFLVSSSMNVTINTPPQPVISGPSMVVIGETSTYCVPPLVPGMLTTWIVTGGSITSGQGTACITVSWDQCYACPNGSVTVIQSANGCTGYTTMVITLLPGEGNLTGYVYYNNSYGIGMDGVTITLIDNSTGTVAATTISGPNMAQNGESGYYSFANLPAGSYHLMASYAGTWGGNNATDALIVQLNVAGTYPLQYLRLAAADVNASLTLSALDALYIKLRTIGSISTYPAGDWKFTDTTFVFSAPVPSMDIKGICMGDVNGSYIPVGYKESPLLSIVEDGLMTVPVGEPFVYNIRSSRDAELGAMTLFMGYDNDRFEVVDVASKSEGMKYAFGDGKISIAWADTKPMNVKTDDLLLSLNLRVKDQLAEPTDVFTLRPGSEFADIMANPFNNFELKMANVGTPGTQELTMYNYPNPFKNTTTILFTLPQSGDVKLVLTDLYGKTMATLADGRYKAGSHSVTVDPAPLHMAPGIYLYKIIFDNSTDTHVKVSKMVFTR